MMRSSKASSKPISRARQLARITFTRKTTRAYNENRVGNRQYFGQTARYHVDGEPVAGKLTHEGVDLGFRPDVPTPRRLIDDQPLGFEANHFASTTFCWSPPPRMPTCCSAVGVLIPESPRIALYHAGFIARPDEVCARDPVDAQRCERHIAAGPTGFSKITGTIKRTTPWTACWTKKFSIAKRLARKLRDKYSPFDLPFRMTAFPGR